MAALTKIKDLGPPTNRSDQNVELFQWDDKFVVVSTVDLGAAFSQADPTQQAVMSLGNMAGGLLGKPVREDGEETMAFYCDETGEDWDYSEITVSHGSGSRERVLARLNELEPGTYGDVID